MLVFREVLEEPGASVLAVPGCSTFFESWLPLFAGKRVRLMYDSDHPRQHPKTGQAIPPGGFEGMRRVAGVMAAAKEGPDAQAGRLESGEEPFSVPTPFAPRHTRSRSSAARGSSDPRR